MLTRPCLWLALALSPPASAQDLALKVKIPGQGEAVRVKHQEQSKTEFKLADADGRVLEEKKDIKGRTVAYRETGLDRAAGEKDFTSLKREYDQAEATFDKVKETLAYQGKTVVIDKKEGKFNFRIDGGDVLDGKDAAELHEEFHKGGVAKLPPDLFVPAQPVKVGASWAVDAAPLAQALDRGGELVFDLAGATGTAKLLKAYQKDGRQFGVVEVRVQLPVTHLAAGGTKTPARDSKLTLVLTSDGCIDGTRTEAVTRGTLEGDLFADIKANNAVYRLTVTVRGTFDGQRVEAGE